MFVGVVVEDRVLMLYRGDELGFSWLYGSCFMACSHCTEGGPGPGTGPGTGRMGYYILCCTVHTALGTGTGTGPGPGPGPGNCTMGCGPIFPYLICVPVMRCNHIQLLCSYIMPFSIVVCS